MQDAVLQLQLCALASSHLQERMTSRHIESDACELLQGERCPAPNNLLPALQAYVVQCKIQLDLHSMLAYSLST
jgi:hypothetical protein